MIPDLHDTNNVSGAPFQYFNDNLIIPYTLYIV